MKNNATEKRGDSQCRSCNNVFSHSDLIIKETERFGFLKEEKVCPHCGSNTYGLIDYPAKEEELIYNSKFNRNADLELGELLDKITEEIIERDMQQYKERIFIQNVNTERLATV